MSKKYKVNEIKALVNGNSKPKFQMRIIIQTKPEDEPEFYKAIPWDVNVNTTVPSKANAESLIIFLKT